MVILLSGCISKPTTNTDCVDSITIIFSNPKEQSQYETDHLQSAK